MGRREDVSRGVRAPAVERSGEKAEGAGHGGMDFIEDYRLIKCLREGLPDMNVCDAAAERRRPPDRAIRGETQCRRGFSGLHARAMEERRRRWRSFGRNQRLAELTPRLQLRGTCGGACAVSGACGAGRSTLNVLKLPGVIRMSRTSPAAPSGCPVTPFTE